MHLDWWTLGLQTINLLVLVWILSRFLFRPIAAVIQQRQSAAAQLLAKAREEQARADEEEKQAEQEKEKAETARGSVLQAAAKEAETEKAQLLAAAHDQADKLIADARAEIERMHRLEQNRSERQASELAVAIAAKLFTRLPASAQVDGFIEGLAAGVAKLPQRARAELGKDDLPIAIKAARDLDDKEIAACEAALGKALGRAVKVSATSEPELIAGLELESPHARVRNSLRADLDRIAGKLTDDGQG